MFKNRSTLRDLKERHKDDPEATKQINAEMKKFTNVRDTRGVEGEILNNILLGKEDK
jgi:hypothetical protein